MATSKGVSHFSKALAGWSKLTGAVLFTLMVAQLAAFCFLLVGSFISALGAARRREWMPLCIDTAFIAANTTAIVRIVAG